MSLDFQAYCVYLKNRFSWPEAKFMTLPEFFLYFNFAFKLAICVTQLNPYKSPIATTHIS